MAQGKSKLQFAAAVDDDLEIEMNSLFRAERKD
jgi:hypothetical protein